MQRNHEERIHRARGHTMRALAGCTMIAGGLFLAGCGSEGDGARQSASSQAAQAEAVHPPQVAAPTATPAESVKPPLPGAGGRESEDPGSLPPDVEVSVTDTLVTPGQEVEFVARGTSDVNRIALADGSGDTLPFVRDQGAGADTWRVSYRVPLRPRFERWGLSVTACSEQNRWRRVWVFLHVQSAGPGAAKTAVAPQMTAGAATTGAGPGGADSTEVPER